MPGVLTLPAIGLQPAGGIKPSRAHIFIEVLRQWLFRNEKSPA